MSTVLSYSQLSFNLETSQQSLSVSPFKVSEIMTVELKRDKEISHLKSHAKLSEDEGEFREKYKCWALIIPVFC